MSPHPARIFVFLALLLAWFLTARAALAQHLHESPEHLDDASADLHRHAPAEVQLVVEEVAVRGPWSIASLGGRSKAASVSLGAFSERRSDGLREVGGLVTLDLPLDRFFLPKSDLRLASLRSPLADDDDEAGDPEDSNDSSEPPLLRERLDAPAHSLSPSSARACVLAAWRAHDLFDDEKLDSLATRARASAALPDLRLRATRAMDASLRLSPTQYDPYRYTEGEAAGHRLEASMSFRLDRLLFADQEIALERIRLQRLDARSKLTTRVLRALFDWQRANALAQDPALSPDEQTAATLRVSEAEATLEVLTAGGCIADTRTP